MCLSLCVCVSMSGAGCVNAVISPVWPRLIYLLTFNLYMSHRWKENEIGSLEGTQFFSCVSSSFIRTQYVSNTFYSSFKLMVLNRTHCLINWNLCPLLLLLMCVKFNMCGMFSKMITWKHESLKQLILQNKVNKHKWSAN